MTPVEFVNYQQARQQNTMLVAQVTALQNEVAALKANEAAAKQSIERDASLLSSVNFQALLLLDLSRILGQPTEQHMDQLKSWAQGVMAKK